ncbi:uncharacterized protein LOC127709654 isoform X2 [Mytilus californianus]|uniref:uncharacterized protein LOC127709654 isoform X2 n=1 Tax=Mytilus californianus TaxID=6549 RepID=UPI002245D8E8|nr:uncharacterized protein LOC127709654 isoform X2 [Mytilus californianus]
MDFNFNIPKIKRQATKDNLRSVTVKGRDAQDVLDNLQRSYLDRNFRANWEVTSVYLVENKTLEDAYRTKRNEMKEDGRHSRELAEQYAYVSMKDPKIAQKVAQDGLKTRELNFNSLGNSKFGVYLCKHADVQLGLFDTSGQETCQLMIFKVTLGKSKVMNLQPTMSVEPTPNYDSHINQLKPSPMDLLNIQNHRSQIYLYEYDDDCEPVQRPRQCLPYALITYKKIKDIPQTALSGASASKYNRPFKPTEVKVTETSELTTIPVLLNRNMSETAVLKIPTGPSFTKDPNRQLSKQERRELFERQHAESLRRQAQEKRPATESYETNKIYYANTDYSKTQTRQDPRMKNIPFVPPQPANIVKQQPSTNSMDPRRLTNERPNRGMGYQKQLSVNIPRQRHMSGGSPSPDGDSIISDALTDLIVKNQIKVDAFGRPVLAIPSPAKSEEEKMQAINQKFAEEIQKHLQMTGPIDVPRTAMEEDYTPQPMEIESSESLDSKQDKNDMLEFDSKISELLNEASLKPIENVEMKTQQVTEVNKESGNEMPFNDSDDELPKLKRPKAKTIDNSAVEEDDDDEKLIIAEMDVESKKLEVLEKRRKSHEGSLEKDLLTFVSREDIKKKDSDKGSDNSKSQEEQSILNRKEEKDKNINIVVVKEETMSKEEQMKMQRAKVLKEVQSMLEKTKEKAVDKIDDTIKNDNEILQIDSNKEGEKGAEAKKQMEDKKDISSNKEAGNLSSEYIDYDLSTFSSDSDNESVRSDDSRSNHSIPQTYSRPSPIYNESPMKVDQRGPYNVQTSPHKMQSKSDSWVCRDLYNAYGDRVQQPGLDNRPEDRNQDWSQQPMHREQINQQPIPGHQSQPQITRPPTQQPHPSHHHYQTPVSSHHQPPIPGQHQTPIYSQQNQSSIPGQQNQPHFTGHQNLPPFPGQQMIRPPMPGHENQQFFPGQQMIRPPMPNQSPVPNQHMIRPPMPNQSPVPNQQMMRPPMPNLPPVPNEQMIRPLMDPPHFDGHSYLPRRHDDPRNYPSQFPVKSRSDSDMVYPPHHPQSPQGHLPSPFMQDTDYRQQPNMNFLNVQDMDHRQNSLIDVNPETGDVDYRRLNPVKPAQSQPLNTPDMRNQFPPNPNMPFNSPPLHVNMPPQPSNQNYSPEGANLQFNPNNQNMLSPPRSSSWGKTETIGLTSPSKEKKISLTAYKARRKNSPIRDGSFEGQFPTFDLDVNNLKNILQTVNVVSALKKDFAESESGDSIDGRAQRYIDDVTKVSPSNVKHTGKLAFLNDVQDDDGLFNCYGGEKIPGIDISPQNITTGQISISSILGTNVDMKKFDVDMRQDQRPEILDAQGTPLKKYYGKYPWEELHVTTQAHDGENDPSPVSTASGKMTPPSSCSSPRGRKKRKIKSGMMGYVKRKRRKKKKNLFDNVSDITGETGSVASSDWRSSIEDLGRVRVMSLEEVGLNHWTDAINHSSFQPRVVLKREKEAEIGAAKIAESNELKSEKEALDSQPEQKNTMVRQWVETSHKKIKLITLKRTKEEDTAKSEKSSILEDVIDIDGLVEKQIAQDMAKSDDAMSISSSSDIIYQKPGPKCSKRPPLAGTHQSIPVLNKRKVLPTQPVSDSLSCTIPRSQDQVYLQSSQGQGHRQVPPYPIVTDISVPPPVVYSTSYPPLSSYPVQSYSIQSFRPRGQGQMNSPLPVVPPFQYPKSSMSNLVPPHPLSAFGQTDFSQPPPQLPSAPYPPKPVVGTHVSSTTPQSTLHSSAPPSHPSLTTNQQMQHPVSHHQPTHQSTTLSHLSITHPAEIRNPLQNHAGQPRILSPGIRPIVAQANFLNRPRLSLYTPQSVPGSSEPQTTTVVTTSVSSNLVDVSTTTGSKRPSDLADWFADKLNPKASQDTVNDPITKLEGSTIMKPKEGTLREELEKLRKNKLEEKEDSKKRKSRSKSKEKSPQLKSKKKRNQSSDNNSDIFEDSENDSKRSLSSYSPSSRGSSRKRSPEYRRRWPYDSPDFRGKYSYSPRRRRSRTKSYSRSHSRSRSRSRSRSYYRRSKSRSRSGSQSKTGNKVRKSPRRRSNSTDGKSKDLEKDVTTNKSTDGVINRSDSVRAKRRSSTSPDRPRRRRTPESYRSRRSSNSPERWRRGRSPLKRSSSSPDSRQGKQSPEYNRFSNRKRISNSPRRSVSPRCRSISPKRRTFESKRRSISPQVKSKSPKRRSISPKVRNKLPKHRSISPKVKSKSPKRKNISPKRKSISPLIQRNPLQKQINTTELKSSGNTEKVSNEREIVVEIPTDTNNEVNKPNEALLKPFLRGPLTLASQHVQLSTEDNKWTKSNFTEYTIDQITEEDQKLQEELESLEEQKKLLEQEDKKMKEEMMKKEDARIRKELIELEKQKKIAEELLELQRQREFAEELVELERQKKLAEELIELEKQRKIAEELVELEKKKKTAEEIEELNKRKQQLEKEVEKSIMVDILAEEKMDVSIDDDKMISDELDELAQQKEKLQKALAALENIDKDSDVCEIDSSGLEDGEIEDDSEDEEKKDESKPGEDKHNPIRISSVIDLTDRAPSRDKRSLSKDLKRSPSRERRESSTERRSLRDYRRSPPYKRRSSSIERRRSRSRERKRTSSIGSDYYDEFNGRSSDDKHRQSLEHSDKIKRQHAKEIGNVWGAMISHNDTRVERIKGDPFFKKTPESKEIEDDTTIVPKPKSLAQKIRCNELITAYDLNQEHQRSVTKTRQELITFADWLKMEYEISDEEIGKYQKYITCVQLDSRIDENSKNKRKTLKKRLRAEMASAQETLKIEEQEKQNQQGMDKPSRNIVVSGVKERLENVKEGDKRIVCDSGVHQLSEIEHLHQPFDISRQQLVSELEMVRSALKMSWKTPKGKVPDVVKNESLGFGEGDYDHEFLMRHDLQQLEAEILMRINHFEFHGVPNRRVPEILLTKKEKSLHFSEEGLFLVMTASISNKAYQNLLSLKKKLEQTEEAASTMNPVTHHERILKHLQEIEVLHQSRKAVMLTIAGYLTKKRFSKLSTRLKYYKRCIQYFSDLRKPELVYLKTTVADVEVHLKLGERLLQEQEGGKPKSLPLRFISLPTQSTVSGQVSGALSAGQTNITQRTTINIPANTIHVNRNVELKASETPRNIPSHTTSQTTQRIPVTSTQTLPTTVHSGLSSGNLRQVPLATTKQKQTNKESSITVQQIPIPTFKQTNQESKLVDPRFKRQNSNEKVSDLPNPRFQRQNSNEYVNSPRTVDQSAKVAEELPQLSRGQNTQDNSETGRNVQYNPRYGSVEKGDPKGESAAISSPYTLPPARYLQQPVQKPPTWGPRDTNQTRSQNDKKLESDLMTVRDKLVRLSQQLNHDQSVRMSVQSVLLSVTEALDLLREESSNLPKVKDIILECLARYNAVKELMEG